MLTVTLNVLVWLRLECLPTGAGTEVECLASVLEFISGGTAADVHSADGILEAGFIKLPFHRNILVQKRKISTIDGPVCSTSLPSLPEKGHQKGDHTQGQQ